MCPRRRVVTTLVAEDEVNGINTRVHLANAEAVMRARILERLMLSGVTILDPASTYIDDTVEIGQDSLILPGTLLQGNTTIGKDCEIGPNSRIVDSQIQDGCRVSYIGDTQIEGDANIGAGTITCNYDGKKKHKTRIGKGVFLGSDTLLVAPLELGENASTGAGAVVTKDVPANTLVYGVPARPAQSKMADKALSEENKD